jgi:hypothetical protein
LHLRSSTLCELRSDRGWRRRERSVGVGLTALGVIIGFVVKDHSDKGLLLAIPPLAFGVNVIWAVENRQIGWLGGYIRRLWRPA